MKTIINTNRKDSFSYPLALSLIVHASAWVYCVNLDHRFEVADRFTQILEQPHLTTQDRFVQVELPPEPKPEPKVVAEVPPPELPKIQPKKKAKRRITKGKQIAKSTPKKKVEIKPSSTLVVQASSDTSSMVIQPSEIVQSTTLQALTSDAPPTVVQRRLSKVELRELQRGYYSELNQIMRKERNYPRSARRQGLEGTVLVELIVDARGKLLSASVVRSSGHKVLDQAALTDVKKMKRLPKPPKELKRRQVKLHIPFEYSLQS